MSYKADKTQSRKIFRIIIVVVLFISVATVTAKLTGLFTDKIPKNVIEKFKGWNETPGITIISLQTCKNKTKTMYVVSSTPMNLAVSEVAYFTEDGESLPTKPGKKIEKTNIQGNPVPVDDSWNPRLFNCKVTPISD